MLSFRTSGYMATNITILEFPPIFYTNTDKNANTKVKKARKIIVFNPAFILFRTFA